MPIEKESWYKYAKDKNVAKEKAQEYWNKAKESVNKNQKDFTDSDWQKVMGTFKTIVNNSLKESIIVEGYKIIKGSKLLQEMDKIKKVIVVKDKRGSEEFEQASFKDIYKKFHNKNVDIYLCIYEFEGAGYVFKREKLIGNAQDNLTMDDYYAVYDEII